MRLCFVIQPFDRGPFDARFKSTLAPAIRDAGLEPYRVDQDVKSVIPADDIESSIRGADACIADISLDNPNVWLEVGLALATNKPLLLLANRALRQTYPFDVQHRHIIRYGTDDLTDFETLKREVTERLRALVFGGTASQTPPQPAPVPARSTLDDAVREEMGRAAELKRAIDDVNAERDAFFTRLLRVCEILAHRAYENMNEPDYASTIQAHSRKEANRVV